MATTMCMMRCASVLLLWSHAGAGIAPRHVPNPDNPVAVMTVSSTGWFPSESGAGTKELVIELFLDQAPVTVSHFIELAESGFYDGTHYHHLTRGEPPQWGDPYSRGPLKQWSGVVKWNKQKFDKVIDMDFEDERVGTGGPEPNSEFKNLVTGETITRDAEGYIPDEFTAGLSNKQNTVAMVGSGKPNSVGSRAQFNVENRPEWDEMYQVFGIVYEGANYIKAFTKQGDGRIKIERIFIRRNKAGSCRRRELQVAAPLRSEREWYAEWQERIGCWFSTLPLPTQGQLGACAGALALSIGSRLDALLGRPLASSPSSSSECDAWVEGATQKVALPEFPQLRHLDFTLPPLPRLLLAPRALPVPIGLTSDVPLELSRPDGWRVSGAGGTSAGDSTTIYFGGGVALGVGVAALVGIAQRFRRKADSGDGFATRRVAEGRIPSGSKRR